MIKNWRSYPIQERKYTTEFGETLKLRYRGNWENINWENTITVVGSRRISMYGERVVERWVAEMTGEKMVIISGFMYGVDSKAHQICCKNNGKTVAVLGGGINYLYPRENDELYSRILNLGGLVISQYEDSFRPTVWSYPERNKTVISLSKIGVLVVEAEMKSGSMLTAKLCSKVNKRLWAVPGPINSSISEGTNFLIASGKAKMFRTVADIVGNREMINQQNWIEDEEGLANDIVSVLSNQELSVDMLAKKLEKITLEEISQKLSLLEIEGRLIEKNGLWRSSS